jgi:hypothetical protein
VNKVKLGAPGASLSEYRTIDNTATRSEVAALLGQPVMEWQPVEDARLSIYEHEKSGLVLVVIFLHGLVSELYLEKSDNASKRVS